MPANHIARWDGHKWSPLGAGITGCRDNQCAPTVRAIVIKGREVYVGGRFTTAGGVAADSIAKWDGRTWFALGSGLRAGSFDAVVWSLALSGSDVFAGGEFNRAGAERANNIARWDGHRWLALGAGIRGGLEKTLAVAATRDFLYVGGDFTQAGEASVGRIAKWDGRRWSALSGGVNGVVRTIAASGDALYVGGDFTQAGAETVSRVAKWDGHRWSALGDRNPHEAVFSIGVNGSNVYWHEKQ